MGYTRAQAEVLFPAIRVDPDSKGRLVRLKPSRYAKKPPIPQVVVTSEGGPQQPEDTCAIPGHDGRALGAFAYLMDGQYYQGPVTILDLDPDVVEGLRARYQVSVLPEGEHHVMCAVDEVERMLREFRPAQIL